MYKYFKKIIFLVFGLLSFNAKADCIITWTGEGEHATPQLVCWTDAIDFTGYGGGGTLTPMQVSVDLDVSGIGSGGYVPEDEMEEIIEDFIEGMQARCLQAQSTAYERCKNNVWHTTRQNSESVRLCDTFTGFLELFSFSISAAGGAIGIGVQAAANLFFVCPGIIRDAETIQRNKCINSYDYGQTECRELFNS